MWVPGPLVGVYVTEQEPLIPLGGGRVHVGLLKLPEPLDEKLTVPVGADLVPAAVSVTVAVQVLAWLTTTEAGEQDTLVVVVRRLTASGKALAELVAWTSAEAPVGL